MSEIGNPSPVDPNEGDFENTLVRLNVTPVPEGQTPDLERQFREAVLPAYDAIAVSVTLFLPPEQLTLLREIASSMGMRPPDLATTWVLERLGQYRVEQTSDQE